MTFPLDEIRQRIAEQGFLKEISKYLDKKQDVEIVFSVGSLQALIVAQYFDHKQQTLLWLFPDQERAEQAKVDLEHLLPVHKSALFPETRISRWGNEDVRTTAQQSEVITALAGNEVKIVLASLSALETRIRSPRQMMAQQITLHVGDSLPFQALHARLNTAGYERVNMVDKPGEFAVRGGIVDIFPFTSENPVRIEFFGDDVESIRIFDAASQRSTTRIEQAVILPRPGGEAETDSSLLDFLPPEIVVFISAAPEVEKIIEERRDEAAGGILPELFDRYLQKSPKAFYTPLSGHFAENRVDVGGKHHPPFDGRIQHLRDELLKKPENGTPQRNYFLCETPAHADRIRQLFDEYGVHEDSVVVIGQSLCQGFRIPHAGLAVYTDHEFYGRTRRRQVRQRFRQGLTLKQLQALKVGDFVVHVNHGIARFKGLEIIKIGGHERECLLLEYRDGDKLYVRLDRMDRVQKYAAKDGSIPTVHKLGSPEWEKLKKKTRSRVKDIARELVQLYALRKKETGHAFSRDDTLQLELEASFPYEDTPDQVTATAEVKKDMENPRPMDRLICGDVGYGKTEIAVRAAFKAILDKKQVAVLVPTTILAEQHGETFRDRLAHFPVRMDVLSRFKTPREQKEIIRKLRTGELDLVIGTHRLLSKDIEFKNLGLLIIDEEQRFGVAAKEKIKQMRVNVDVLALSATPIPRTLQMSLLGIRDMSLITTPPRDRLPIHTETIEFDPRIIRQAMLHELQRGGQIFFVHNRIETIEMIAARLQEIVPEADIIIAHGRMKEKELEKVMHDFMQKKYHILVSTMIIESGLDIPNVNTIFINRADKFGLAQLYQLRGRVGRSSRKAYCYLIIPPLKKLTREAIQRLETVEEFTELGSGFQIAMRDLEIRGAGSILGGEQSGFIESLGIDLYMKILDEAIKEFQQEEAEEQEERDLLPDECRVDADVDAYLPQNYVGIPSERVEIYRQVAHARDYARIEDVREELQDRFGRLPEEAENMLNIAACSLLGRQAGFARIAIKKQTAACVFDENLVQQGQEQFKALLGKMVLSASAPVELFQGEKTGIKLTFPEDRPALPALKTFLFVALQAEGPEQPSLTENSEQGQENNNGDRRL